MIVYKRELLSDETIYRSAILIVILNASKLTGLFNAIFHRMKMLDLKQEISILVSGAFLKSLRIYVM